MRCSILIMTLNEELNIERCLQSVLWSDDIVVLDSFSDDQTILISEQFDNVRVVQNEFVGYASQRNFGLTQISYQYQWLLMVDADEVVTPELASEVSKVISDGSRDTVMYRMRRKDYFFGKWLKRASGYPTWFGRLMKRGQVRVEREINEEYVTDGGVENLSGHLHHYPFSKGIAWWFDRHNRYSSMEANELLVVTEVSIKLTDLFASDPVARRKTLKCLAYKMPFRPLIAFVYLYVFRLGMLDGIVGLRFCVMRSIYEYMIDLKAKEARYLQKMRVEK